MLRMGFSLILGLASVSQFEGNDLRKWLILRAEIFWKWSGLHYMVRELDGDKFAEEVERAVARLSDGAGGLVPFQVR